MCWELRSTVFSGPNRRALFKACWESGKTEHSARRAFCALQRRVGAQVDGVLGPDTITKLQVALNRGTLPAQPDAGSQLRQNIIE
jgi:lysozyme family protein